MVSKTDYNLIVGCDMPFLNVSFLEYMISQSEGYELTIPKFGAKYQPLCAVYSKGCIPKIKRMIEENKLKLDSLVFEVDAKLIEEREVMRFDPDGTMFFNVNTKFEYQKALEIAERERESE
jgi:molybdopterin-guanine dinucleotide biosynthesis protein A